MHTTYYIATATYQNHKHVFVYKPGKPGTLTERKETVEELERSAAEKGFEVSYVSMFQINNVIAGEIIKLLVPIMRNHYPESKAYYTLCDNFSTIKVPETPPFPIRRK